MHWEQLEFFWLISFKDTTQRAPILWPNSICFYNCLANVLDSIIWIKKQFYRWHGKTRIPSRAATVNHFVNLFRWGNITGLKCFGLKSSSAISVDLVTERFINRLVCFSWSSESALMPLLLFTRKIMAWGIFQAMLVSTKLRKSLCSWCVHWFKKYQLLSA